MLDNLGICAGRLASPSGGDLVKYMRCLILAGFCADFRGRGIPFVSLVCTLGCITCLEKFDGTGINCSLESSVGPPENSHYVRRDRL